MTFDEECNKQRGRVPVDKQGIDAKPTETA